MQAAALALAALSPAATLPSAESDSTATPTADLVPAPPPPPAVATVAPPPTFASAVLTLSGFTARVEDRTILKELSLCLGERGLYALMGPGGSGKSSLTGILSGRNRAATGWTLSGEIRFAGQLLGAAARPTVIGQKLAPVTLPLRRYLLAELDEGVAESFPDAQLHALLARARLAELRGHLDSVLGSAALRPSPSQWWRLAIARELTTEPILLCIDEPTAALSDEEAAPILALLREEADKRAVLLVTHNQQQARDYSDYVILLAGGRVQEYSRTADFFARPCSRAARDYVRTGSCYVPSPDARPEFLPCSASRPPSPLSWPRRSQQPS
jgi:atypical dual specificity phosphatase